MAAIMPAWRSESRADPVPLQETGEGVAGELRPLVGVEISGIPFLRASSRASTQKSDSRVLDSRLDNTYRLYQSLMATRYRKSRAMGR
jgi:hypothetical protein